LVKLFPSDWHVLIRATLDDAGIALRLWLGAQVASMVIVGFFVGIGAWRWEFLRQLHWA
jgi:predicted PurR-regulated permease PerM